MSRAASFALSLMALLASFAAFSASLAAAFWMAVCSFVDSLNWRTAACASWTSWRTPTSSWVICFFSERLVVKLFFCDNSKSFSFAIRNLSSASANDCVASVAVALTEVAVLAAAVSKAPIAPLPCCVMSATAAVSVSLFCATPVAKVDGMDWPEAVKSDNGPTLASENGRYWRTEVRPSETAVVSSLAPCLIPLPTVPNNLRPASVKSMVLM